jgi:hypothetical protein
MQLVVQHWTFRPVLGLEAKRPREWLTGMRPCNRAAAAGLEDQEQYRERQATATQPGAFPAHAVAASRRGGRA